MVTRKTKPCVNGDGRPKLPGHPRWCGWCWLAKQPAETQITYADQRLVAAKAQPDFEYRARVPASEWPAGARWCSGCQSFVPLEYTSGSRCKACDSRAKHASHIKRTYDLDREEWERLWRWQRGRCYICGRRLHSRRPAVDHDHDTGLVRGLLCADNERGCNHAILGNISDLEMARRIVAYLERPPLDRMRAGEPPVVYRRDNENRPALEPADLEVLMREDPPPF